MQSINQAYVPTMTTSTQTQAQVPTQPNQQSSWFEAMSGAWGRALDNQAQKIADMSEQVGSGGSDTPAAITALTAESLKFTFLSNSSHTAISSVGSSLDTMARKN